MEVIPIHTRILQPPKEDLFAVMEDSLLDVREGDILIVASKVAAIHQGRCVRGDFEVVEKIRNQEAEYTLKHITPSGRTFHITIKGGAFVSGGGIDRSNGNGYLVLWPENREELCSEIWQWLRKNFGIRDVGVILADSQSTPLRLGAIGVAIGCFGFQPLRSHVGRQDLFGRTIRVERTNVVDSLAVAAVFTMGEANESTPLCLARGVRGIQFIDKPSFSQILVDSEEDKFAPLLKPLIDHPLNGER